MPRSKEQNEEIRQQRKEAILTGALQIYAERGYAAADIGDVAERAGVARGLVYYYFKDKQTLFRELFVYMFNLSEERRKAHFERDGAVLELIESFIAAMYDGLLEHPEYALFFMRMRHDVHALFTEEELKDLRWHDDHLRPVVEALERGMREGTVRRMNVELLTAQFWAAAIHGLAHSQKRAQAMKAEGMPKEAIAAALRPDLRDALAVCMDIIVAERRQTPVSEQSEGSGVDRA